jgi:hypothetical protein
VTAEPRIEREAVGTDIIERYRPFVSRSWLSASVSERDIEAIMSGDSSSRLAAV